MVAHHCSTDYVHVRPAFAGAAGVDLRTVMSITGHTTPGVLLKHYTQVVSARQREAVEGLFKGVEAEGGELSTRQSTS